MKLIVNGNEEILLQTLTLQELIEMKGWTPDTIVAELNLEIISKKSWADIVLADNDRLEILSFIGGGR